MLVAGMSEHWSVAGLTSLVYSIPKQQRGLPADTKPDAELKAAQREFFKSVYMMLCNSHTGPRLPTLLLILGQEKVRTLLAP